VLPDVRRLRPARRGRGLGPAAGGDVRRQKLATIQGVLSTATHFILKPYKEQGVLMKPERHEERLAVTP